MLLTHLTNEPTNNFFRLCPLLSFPGVTPVSDVQAVGGDAHYECQQGDGPSHYLRYIHQLKVLVRFWLPPLRGGRVESIPSSW